MTPEPPRPLPTRPNPSGSSPGAGWFGWVCAGIAALAMVTALVVALTGAGTGGSC